jgi:hypothetical protein
MLVVMEFAFESITKHIPVTTISEWMASTNRAVTWSAQGCTDTGLILWWHNRRDIVILKW